MSALLDRIEARLEYEPNTGCWLWAGSTDGRYGQISVDGRLKRTHVIMFAEHVRPLAPGEKVLHKCDTPSCVNPAHLFGGTQRDNMIDRARKGRNSMQTHPEKSSLHWVRVQVQGETHPRATLSDIDVAKLRAAYGCGASTRDLGRQFRINKATAWKLATGRSRAGLSKDTSER